MEAAHPLLPAGSPFLPDTIDSPRMIFDDAAWLPLARAYAAEVAARRSAMKPR